MKVMIVDDSPRFRKLLKRIIDRNNTFFECSDGEEALQSYSSFSPDWVTMDIEMPKMNGFDASQIIINQYPNAKILMVTQYDESEFRQKSENIGIVGFVNKENLDALLEYL